jgi:hypothetical protein
MPIPFLLTGPNLRRIDSHLDTEFLWVFRIELERAMNILKVSADMGYHHMPDAKFSRGMSGF